MKLYRTRTGVLVEEEKKFFALKDQDWDQLLANPLIGEVARKATEGAAVSGPRVEDLLSPAGAQEVWAAGVTYYRSRNARMDESKDAGGGTFYDRVYGAERPELFFKANGPRVIGPGGTVRIRKDATWSVPEPELTLLLCSTGRITGFTIGNDMSSRDIEGENPLYLPQAKVYDGSCALGPAILLTNESLPKSTAISLEILRSGSIAFSGSTTLAELKREPQELAEYLFRENSFSQGAFLMTGTGVVPGDDFTLAAGDVVRISIDGIGTLENTVG